MVYLMTISISFNLFFFNLTPPNSRPFLSNLIVIFMNTYLGCVRKQPYFDLKLEKTHILLSLLTIFLLFLFYLTRVSNEKY